MIDTVDRKIEFFELGVPNWLGSLNRYNIPELAKTYTVYAMDLLGFGLSEKALIEYNANVWRDQVGDFLKEVVGKPAVLAGNR